MKPIRTTIRVFSKQTSFFTGKKTNCGIDTDGDGFYDELNINVGIRAAVWGTYEVHGILEDNQGNYIASTAQTVKLKEIPADALLTFNGVNIFNSGCDGPYQVKIVITDGNDEEVAGVLYHTSKYSHTRFDHPKVTVGRVFSDSAFDTNSDGFYDFLRIKIDVNVAKGGNYNIEASLLPDGDGSSLAVMGTVARQPARRVSFPPPTGY